MKTCPGCGWEKPLNEFWANKSRSDGLQHRCKDCHREAMSEYNTRRDVVYEFPPGRRCSEPGCGTLLSRYHRGPKCHAHEASERVQLLRAIADGFDLDDERQLLRVMEAA